MKFNKIWFVFVVFAGILLLSNCRKSDRNNEEINPAPYENAFAEIIFNDIFRVLHSVAVEDAIVNAPQDATVTNTLAACINSVNYAYVTETFPNTMVVDFGTEQTACTLGGRIRTGKIRFDFSGKYSDSLSVMKVKLVDYYADSIKLTADMTITNRGRNTNNQPRFKVVVNNAVIEKDTLNYTWSANWLYTWTAGYTTVTLSDDKFELSGSSEGSTSKGNTYTSSISKSLTTDFSCNWLYGGEEYLQPEGLAKRTVTYSASCSSTVNVKYYNTEYELTLE